MDGYPLFTPRSGGGGAGGGGWPLKWIEDANAPTLTVANYVEIYGFGAGLGQLLYAAIRVPAAYTSGTQIFMKVLIYSPDTSGNILFQSTATLIRTEVDEITSISNQYSSTNTAITMAATNDLEPQAVSLDITDVFGEINGTAVSAGDLIIVKVFRGSDTATSDLQFIHQATEVTFT